MPPALVALLLAWREEDRRAGLDHGPIIRTEEGGCFQDFPRNLWSDVLRAAGIDEGVPHLLRHTSVTRLLEHCFAKTFVAAYAGMSIPTLEATYATRTPRYGLGGTPPFESDLRDPMGLFDFTQPDDALFTGFDLKKAPATVAANFHTRWKRAPNRRAA
jgi:hypothetical protein